MKNALSRHAIAFVVTVLGISHIITQISVIREFINVFAGNEVVVGVLFALWLLISGIGAWLGRFFTSSSVLLMSFRVCLLLAAFLPIGHIVLIRILRYTLFIRGELPGIGALVIWAFVLIGPYCIITGALLTMACSIMASPGSGGKSIGRVYFFDNIGDILGGLLFTFILVHFLNNISLLYVPAFLCLVGFMLVRGEKSSAILVRVGAGATGIMVLILLVMYPVDKTTLNYLYPGQTIIDHRESPYGRVVVTKNRDQLSFFENGGHVFSTPNIYASEELVHFALPQRETADSVLLISGGIAGTVTEILKYDVSHIDYVELDPSIIEMGTMHLDLRFPPPVAIHLEDGRAFVMSVDCTYSAVILDLPDPSSLQLNRFYSVQFFRDVKRILQPEGILSFAVQGAENYISDDLARFLSTIRNSLARVFAHVILIPGERTIVMASDASLTPEVGPLLARHNIRTVFVNETFLMGRVTPERMAFIHKSLQPTIPVNSDFTPTAFYYTIRVWLSMFQERYTVPLILALLFFLGYFVRSEIAARTLFTTGFTASSMEVILLLGYQITQGSLYTGIGLIIASFMLGLAIGSFGANLLPQVGYGTLLKIEFGIMVYLLAFMLFLSVGTSFAGTITFSFLAILIGALTGAEFPVAGRLVFVTPWETAGTLYTADLLGGSAGAFTVSVLLIPRIGIYYTCIILVMLKLLIVPALLVKMKR